MLKRLSGLFSCGRARGAYLSEDRQGHPVFHPLLSLSIGVLRVPPRGFPSHREIAAAAASAKREAKKLSGLNLFVERRDPTPAA